MLKLGATGFIVHIGKVDFDFLINREIICVAIVHIEFGLLCLMHGGVSRAIFFKLVDCLNGAVDESFDAGKCQLKGVNGTLQTLQKVNAHQTADTLLMFGLHETFAFVMCQFRIFLPFT